MTSAYSKPLFRTFVARSGLIAQTTTNSVHSHAIQPRTTNLFINPAASNTCRIHTLVKFKAKPSPQASGILSDIRKIPRRTMATEQAEKPQLWNNNNATPSSFPSSNDKNASPNAWQQPGPAAYDFRSDVVTTPTASMLSAIVSTTLFDDVFLEDPTTLSLEKHISTLTSHSAALFVLSGTMGNQIALRAHLTQPPHSVLCDHRAHILEWEAGGVASLSGALVTGVTPKNGKYLTLEDIQEKIVLSDDVHSCPTKVISLENTLAGTIMPLSETLRICTFARENEIKLHLDGARLWEVVIAEEGSLSDFTTLFDSVSLCFSKGLGAPVGSILVGNSDFIKRARWIRKSIGGGLRQAGVVTAAARIAVDETFGKGVYGEGGLLKKSHENSRRIAKRWEGLGGRLERGVETNMVWLDLEKEGLSAKEFVVLGEKVGLRFMGGRLVVHYQISEDAIERLGKLMERILSKDAGLVSVGGKGIEEAAERNMDVEVE